MAMQYTVSIGLEMSHLRVHVIYTGPVKVCSMLTFIELPRELLLLCFFLALLASLVLCGVPRLLALLNYNENTIEFKTCEI